MRDSVSARVIAGCLIIWLGFLDQLVSRLARISQAHVAGQQILNTETGCLRERFADDAAADVRGARIAQRKLMAGEITRRPGEIRVIQRSEIITEQGRLFELLGRSGHGFGRLRKSFQRVECACLTGRLNVIGMWRL